MDIREEFEKWYQDHPWHQTNIEASKEAMLDAWEAALIANGGEAVEEGLDRAAIEEAMVEGGWWKPCSGCYETVDGQPVGSSRKTVFGCEAGGGCDECGGIGVIWEEAPTDEQLALLSVDPDSRPAPPSVTVPDDVREAVAEAIAEALGGAMDCTRVWSAWGVGTMGESDFVEVASDAERINEITEAAISAMLSGKEQ